MSDHVRGWAPGRVNLIGDHTDYNDGLAMPMALTVGTTVDAVARHDRVLRIVSRQESTSVEISLERAAPGSVVGWASYVVGTAWALAADGVEVSGADLVVDGDVPRGAGLSSSASLECATAAALLALAHDARGLREVALLAQRAENEFVGVPCGMLDQMAVTHGRAGHVLLLDCRSLQVTPYPFDLDAHGLALLVIDTRAPHRLVDGGYAARRASCVEAAARLGLTSLREVDDLASALAALDDGRLRRRVRHVVTENGRVLTVAGLLTAGDVRAIGPVLTASHRSLRDDFEVSCPELDLAVDVALEAGAWGARMTGGGFGGSVIALVDASRADTVRAQVRARFGLAGLPEPAFLLAEAGAGYGVVR